MRRRLRFELKINIFKIQLTICVIISIRYTKQLENWGKYDIH